MTQQEPEVAPPPVCGAANTFRGQPCVCTLRGYHESHLDEVHWVAWTRARRKKGER